MMIGWLSLAVAAVTFALAIGEVGARAVAGIASATLLGWISSGFFTLFLVFWSVGYIVRAISYLPGQGERS
jgi:hypothetical protein